MKEATIALNLPMAQPMPDQLPIAQPMPSMTQPLIAKPVKYGTGNF